MLTETRGREIYEKAKMVNAVSDEYQLIHATFALEKIFNKELKEKYGQSIAELRKQIANESDAQKLATYSEKARELTDASRKQKVKISLIYVNEIDENSARTTKTKNTYMILLPEKLKKIRNEDGTINIEKLKQLRHLMAHELGHILLHSNSIVNGEPQGTDLLGDMEEEEADYFAKHLIELRKMRNDELYKNSNYTQI